MSDKDTSLLPLSEICLKLSTIVWLLILSMRLITHSVTFHPTQVNLHPSQIGRYFIYLPWRDGRLSWPRWLDTYRDGLPTHRGSPIQVLTGQCTAGSPTIWWRQHLQNVKKYSVILITKNFTCPSIEVCRLGCPHGILCDLNLPQSISLSAFLDKFKKKNYFHIVA